MSISMLKEGYWVSDGGRGEPKQVGRVTPCAPLCPPNSRRARSDAPYPPSLRHYARWRFGPHTLCQSVVSWLSAIEYDTKAMKAVEPTFAKKCALTIRV